MEVIPVVVCELSDAIHNLPEIASDAGFKLQDAQLGLIKPNVCGLYHPSLNLLSTITEFLLTHVESVVVGETESMMHSPREQFRALGIVEALERFKERVKLVDLSENKAVKVPVPRPHALKEVDIPKTILDSDVIVNVPKVGTHSTTRLTCALKNLFGLLPQGRKYSIYHPLGMDKVIADVAQVVKPELNVVDAGSNVIVSVDALAADIVACEFVDLDPRKVEHLRLTSEDLGLNLDDYLKKIKVLRR